MARTAALLLFPCLAAAILPAQTIQYSDSRKIWLITTRQSSYAMGLAADGALRHLYWGAPLWRMDDLPAPGDHTFLTVEQYLDLVRMGIID